MALNYFINVAYEARFRKPIKFLPATGFNKARVVIDFYEVAILREDGFTFFASTKCTGSSEPQTPEEIGKQVFNFLNGNETGKPHDEFIQDMMERKTFDEWARLHHAMVQKTLNESRTRTLKYEYFAQPKLYSLFDGGDSLAFLELWSGLPMGLSLNFISVKQAFDAMITEVTERFFKFVSSEGSNIVEHRSFDEMWELNRNSFKENADFPVMKSMDVVHIAEFTKALHYFIKKYKPR